MQINYKNLFIKILVVIRGVCRKKVKEGLQNVLAKFSVPQYLRKKIGERGKDGVYHGFYSFHYAHTWSKSDFSIC